MYANNSFLEENRDYVRAVLEGYSHALGWVMMNPGEAVDFIREDVNDALAVQERDTQIETVKIAIVAANLLEDLRESGLCSLEEEILQNTYDNLTEALGLGDEPPSTDDTADFESMEEADLRVLSEDEFSEAEENAQRYIDMYREN